MSRFSETIIDTGIDVCRIFGGEAQEASVVLSSLNYFRLLIQRSIEKKSPNYAIWPAAMWTFTKFETLSDTVRHHIIKILPATLRNAYETYEAIPQKDVRCSVLLKSWMAFRMI